MDAKAARADDTSKPQKQLGLNEQTNGGRFWCTYSCCLSSIQRGRPDLTCTVKAHAPAFSILLANSTVSLGEPKRRILALTGTERFLLRVLSIDGRTRPRH